ncbi:tRNA pseudouridine synthase A [uncultured bacterium]|nr:tRNA pseudouridine synthase A [uncultured bacterium]
MRNLKLIIEYEGTNYSGWQAQKTLPTVQGTLVQVARRLTRDENASVAGASRTDAGVHALGQVVGLKADTDMSCQDLIKGLNFFLPDDIVVKEAIDMPPDFDPRRGSKGKIYLYRIVNRNHPSALLRNFSWNIFNPLDLGAMREAATHFIGEKDFSSFMAADSDANHAVREVTSVEIFEKEDGLLEIEVRGTAFLRHMVRIMVGTLVAVGKGKRRPADIHGIIDARSREAAGMTAPAQGLCLVRVEY